MTKKNSCAHCHHCKVKSSFEILEKELEDESIECMKDCNSCGDYRICRKVYSQRRAIQVLKEECEKSLGVKLDE